MTHEFRRVNRQCIEGADPQLEWETHIMKSRMALALLTSLVVAGCSGTDATSPIRRDLRPSLDPSADRSSADADPSSKEQSSHERSSLRIKFEKWFTTAPNMVGNTS